MTTPLDPRRVAVAMDAVREEFGNDTDVVRWLQEREHVGVLLSYAPIVADEEGNARCATCGVLDFDMARLRPSLADEHHRDCAIAKEWRLLGEERAGGLGNDAVLTKGLAATAVREAFGERERRWVANADIVRTRLRMLPRGPTTEPGIYVCGGCGARQEAGHDLNCDVLRAWRHLGDSRYQAAARRTRAESASSGARQVQLSSHAAVAQLVQERAAFGLMTLTMLDEDTREPELVERADELDAGRVFTLMVGGVARWELRVNVIGTTAIIKETALG